jgi:D-alanyl-D-alanine carboxypeptidase/D-alanyl-D-alanine carboxypeptidase (penicillin-binding protein 5/6)
MQNQLFRTVVSTRKATIPHAGQETERLLVNHNKLLRIYDDCIGVKTGFTKRSGRCLVSCAERNGARLVAVTLNAPDDWKDHRAMQEYGFARYSNRILAEEGQFSLDISCPTAPEGKLTLVNKDSLRLCLPVDAEVTRHMEAPHYVFPPVSEGDCIGRVVFSSDGKEIGAIPLYAAFSVPEPEDNRGFAEKLLDFIK